MDFRPEYNVIKEIADSGEYKTAPVSCEILSDISTPIEVLRKLKNVSSHCYLLESVADREKWGRYTFLGFQPKLEITCTGDNMKIGDVRFKTTNPAEYIRQVLAEYKSPRFDYLPTFTGGLVGYFSYDFLKYSEPSVDIKTEDGENFKDIDLMLFDKVIAFDNFRQKIILIANLSLSEPETGYRRAVRELEQIADLLANGEGIGEENGYIRGEIKPLFDKEEYCEMVEKAKEHIFEGDIFQIVLSNRLCGGNA